MGTGPTPSRNFGTRNDIGRQRVIHEVAERLRVDHDIVCSLSSMMVVSDVFSSPLLLVSLDRLWELEVRWV